MNHRGIAMMFICPSVTGMHRDHTVHFSVDLRLLLDSPCSGHPDTKACPPTPNHLSAKNYQNWWKFGEVLAKTNLHSFFFRYGVQLQLQLLLTHVCPPLFQVELEKDGWE